MKKIGLLSGKMGACICLFHYFRVYNDKSYGVFAKNLIEEVQDMIDMNTPWEYANGLAGIGSGFSYLVRNEFIEGEEEDIFSEFDSSFFQNVYYGKHQDLTRDHGLIGIGSYFLNRFQNEIEGSFTAFRLKEILLLIQDIVFARLRMEGYTYPYAIGIELSNREIKDCKRFLKRILKMRLCPELTEKALSIVEKLDIDKNDAFDFRVNQKKDDSTGSIKTYMNSLSEMYEYPIVRHLTALQLQDFSLPPWWELF